MENSNLQASPQVKRRIDEYGDSLAYRLLMALEHKDRDSRMHSSRVAELAGRFSQALGNSPAVTAMIHETGMVHDVGKIGISNDVLMCPGKLNQLQWEEMKTHSSLGAQILDRMYHEVGDEYVSAIYYREIRSGVLYHHERWDGKGYPAGLSGKEIPYVARIIAVCDSVDAMLSNRIYRQALTEEQCRNEIINNAGKMYDPQLAAAFVANWHKILGGMYGIPN